MASTGFSGFRPARLTASVSMKLAYRSPTFWRSEPGVACSSCAASSMISSRCFSASSASFVNEP